MTVELELLREGVAKLTAPLQTVKFQYLLNLKLVSAHCDTPADNLLLAALFPFDDGQSINGFESICQLQNGTFRFDPSRPAKPYRCDVVWCGLPASLLCRDSSLHAGIGQPLSSRPPAESGYHLPCDD